MNLRRCHEHVRQSVQTIYGKFMYDKPLEVNLVNGVRLIFLEMRIHPG